MSWKSLLPIGLLALVIGLIAFLPARVAATWLEANTPDITLSGVSGTLLDGHAQYLVTQGRVVEDVHWSLRPAKLLTGRFAALVQVSTDLGDISGTVAYTFWGDKQLSNIHGSASLGWLAKRAGYAFVPITGDLRVDIDSVSLSERWVPTAVVGQVQVANVYWQLMRPPLQIGSYSARLGHSEGQLKLTLTDSKGPLAIDGSAVFLPSSHTYTVEAQLRARAGADDRLKNLLGVLGQTDNGGWHNIRQHGQLQL